MASIKPFLDKILSAIYGEEVRGSIHDALEAMNDESSAAYDSAIASQTSAANSANSAATSATNASNSASAAAESATSASKSAASAQTSAGSANQAKTDIETLVTNASSTINTAVTQATNSATMASTSASSASESANTASASASNASISASAASESATSAQTSATNASNSATLAGTNATNASNSATLSESYTKGGTGTRQGESTDNAKYYAELAESYAQSASQGVEPATTTKLGGVKPDGTTITVDADGTIHGSAQVNVATTNAAGIVKPDGTTITVDQDGTIHGVGGSNVSVDGNTIVKDGNNVISVNEYVGTKAQADANLNNIPDGATVYTTDEGGELSVIDTELNASSNHAIANSTVTTALSSKTNKSDITNISITGTTNNTGSNILAGTLFYLNGTLCKTLTDVADGTTFTKGTNYNPYTIATTHQMADYMFNNLQAQQMSDLNIFNNSFSVFFDWSGYLRSNVTDFTMDFLVALRLPSTDRRFIKMIAIGNVSPNKGDIFIFNIDCISRKISLLKRL